MKWGIKDPPLMEVDNMKSIYFGHSRMTYDTEMETQALNIIRKNFPEYEIINPKLEKYQKECRAQMKEDHKPGDEIGYFLKLSDQTEFGCFLQYYERRWSAGSATEINYILGCGKKAYLVNLEKETLDQIVKPVKSLSFDETYKRLIEAGRSGDGVLRKDRRSLL
jgi:hypothetical protein